MLQEWRRFLTDTRGSTAVDYGLVAVLIGAAVVGAFSEISGEIAGLLRAVGVDIAQAAMSLR